MTTCRTSADTCAAHYHDLAIYRGDVDMGPVRADGDDSPMHTMGCHGPPGLGWFLRELQPATEDTA